MSPSTLSVSPCCCDCAGLATNNEEANKTNTRNIDKMVGFSLIFPIDFISNIKLIGVK